MMVNNCDVEGLMVKLSILMVIHGEWLTMGNQCQWLMMVNEYQFVPMITNSIIRLTMVEDTNDGSLYSYHCEWLMMVNHSIL